jgi:hypothetical protein
MSWGMTIAAVVSAGAAAYGSHKAGKEADKLKKQQQPLIDAQKKQLTDLQPFGKSFLQQGQANTDIVQNYLRQMASGNRNTTMQALAPEINAATQGQQGAVTAQRSLFPRGGQSASQAAQQPYQFQGMLNNLMFAQRPQAMQQLAQLGGNQASLGLGAYGQGAGLTNNMLNYGLNAQQQMFGQGAAIGQGISSMVGPFLQYYMMNRQTTPTNTNAQIPTGSTYNWGSGPGVTTGNSMSGQSTPNTSSYSPYTYPGGRA